MMRLSTLLLLFHLNCVLVLGAKPSAQPDLGWSSRSSRKLHQSSSNATTIYDSLAATDDVYSPCLGPDWSMLWRDEFSGPGAAPDPTKWGAQEGDGVEFNLNGWGNQELQYYTNRLENAYVQDGRLVIQAQRESGATLDAVVAMCFIECSQRCSLTTPAGDPVDPCVQACSVPRCDTFKNRGITSARLRTYGRLAVSPSDQFSAVRVEGRIKLPRGAGLWPAFWMLPEQGARADCVGCGDYGGWPSSGEIDIMEGRNDMSSVIGTLFYGGEGEVQQVTADAGPASEGYSLFSLEWDAQQMRWSMDGRQYHVVDSGAKLGAQGLTGGWYTRNGVNNAPFDVPFYILLNLAVGGAYPQVDPDVALSEMETGAKQMEVDFVRVCGKPLAQETTAASV